MTNYQELALYGTATDRLDSDNDGFNDLYEIHTGFDPNSDLSTPTLLSQIKTAIEFRFNAALEQTFKIEGSTDFAEWVTLEMDIPGTGSEIVRFYFIKDTPYRFFRATEQ